MKPCILIACLLFAVSAASCTTDEHFVISSSLELGRVASEEEQFSKDVACTAAATKYNDEKTPTPVSTEPLVYSFKKNPLFRKKYEVRFVTNPSVKPEGKKISYYEIDRISVTDNALNAAAIIAAIAELKKKGATIVQDTTLDELINEKRAWRVVMHTDGPLKDKNGNFTKIKDDFGVIINPPYPP